MLKQFLVAASVIGGAVPAIAQTPRVATTIYDATGGAENGGDSFLSAGLILADQVLTTSAGVLQSVTLQMEVEHADVGTFRVVIGTVGANGAPANLQTVAMVPYMALTSKFSPITVTAATAIPLAANTAYYVGITRGVGARSSLHLGNTVDPTVLARPSVVAGANYYNNGGVQANSGGPYEIKVTTVGAAAQ